MKIPDHPLGFRNREAWRTWLQEQHATHTEAWLVIKKNHVTDPGVFYAEAVEEALCYGWIDGAMKSAGDEFYFLRFSPRKRDSIWPRYRNLSGLYPCATLTSSCTQMLVVD
jgi:uncharacterized protein YdeI (YjbR/CyaY-like superfamily)